MAVPSQYLTTTIESTASTSYSSKPQVSLWRTTEKHKNIDKVSEPQPVLPEVQERALLAKRSPSLKACGSRRAEARALPEGLRPGDRPASRDHWKSNTKAVLLRRGHRRPSPPRSRGINKSRRNWPRREKLRKKHGGVPSNNGGELRRSYIRSADRETWQFRQNERDSRSSKKSDSSNSWLRR